MPSQIYIYGSWGFYLTAIMGLGVLLWLAVRIIREWPGEKPQYGAVPMMLSIFLTSIWAFANAMDNGSGFISSLFENLRNLSWISFLSYIAMAEQQRSRKPFMVLAIGLGLLAIAIILARSLYHYSPELSEIRQNAFYIASLMSLIFAVGALLLLHNVYLLAAPETRDPLLLPTSALVAMWLYELNLYIVAWIQEVAPYDLIALRGILFLLIMPLFILSSARTRGWRMRLSRKATFHFLSLFAIFIYLSLMLALFQFLIQNQLFLQGRVVLIALVFSLTLLVMIILSSNALRSWIKVKLTKHFFQHRYDYREEWLGFTHIIGHGDNGGSDDNSLEHPKLGQRIIKAVANLTNSPEGILLTPDETGQMILDEKYNWPEMIVPAIGWPADTAEEFARSGLIVELDELRSGSFTAIDPQIIPQWVMDTPRIWVLIPLRHFERLTGVLMLSRPALDRKLDWEDFDLLQVVSRQIASYLAEARSQQILLESARFDEFNRRFAFVLHDIKNLVSQLSLVSRNTRRHADNPEFRKDMIETLENSVQKLSAMLSRLSGYQRNEHISYRNIDPYAILSDIAAQMGQQHPIELDCEQTEILQINAAEAQLRQLLLHLVQNAIDASNAYQPVILSATRRDGRVIIAISDQGCGMDSDFIRKKLFKPFVSNKADGFGIGAYEARILANSMNGQINVFSQPNKGSLFEVCFAAVNND